MENNIETFSRNVMEGPKLCWSWLRIENLGDMWTGSSGLWSVQCHWLVSGTQWQCIEQLRSAISGLSWCCSIVHKYVAGSEFFFIISKTVIHRRQSSSVASQFNIFVRVGAIQCVVLLLQCVKRVYDLQAAVNVGLSAAMPTQATETRSFVTKAHK